jgi:sugar phosphate isomerase/epimerase
MKSDISRRTLLAAGTALLSAKAVAQKVVKPKLKVAIFSKHLQFIPDRDGLAQAAAEIGFDAIDLAVRKGGHVEPERVRQDLPGMVAAIRKRGLDVPMVTTDIVDIETPHAEDILKTMADLGIRNYRWGGFKYTTDQPYAAQLDRMKARIAKLAALNSRYQACAMYHTHSGTGVVGASIWDLYLLLKDFDPHAVGVNYDVGHATVEGGLGGWINSFRITGPHVRCIAIKDFLWGQDSKGAWQPQWKPLGEGMVHFPQFFAMVASSDFSGPLQMHFEYPLPRDKAFSAMKRDLGRVRAWLAQANL